MTGRIDICILREALHVLPVLLRWAIPGPQNVGRAAGTALTHSVYKLDNHFIPPGRVDGYSHLIIL